MTDNFEKDIDVPSKEIIKIKGINVDLLTEDEIERMENWELVDLVLHFKEECERLKDKLIKLLGKEGITQSEKEFYEQQLDQLKAENEELKEQLDSVVREWEEYTETYKQVLQEIKEIAEKTINSSDCYERMYGGMCARPILNKISEVLDEEVI